MGGWLQNREVEDGVVGSRKEGWRGVQAQSLCHWMLSRKDQGKGKYGMELKWKISGGIGGQVTGISSPNFGNFSGTRRRCMVLRSASFVPGTGHICHSVIPKKEPTTNNRAQLWALPCPPRWQQSRHPTTLLTTLHLVFTLALNISIQPGFSYLPRLSLSPSGLFVNLCSPRYSP